MDSILPANMSSVAIVFAPTLNIPAPLIQLFLTDYPAIFGEGVEETHSPIKEMQASSHAGALSDGIRSPRHQMFSDLPTPGYNQHSFNQRAIPGFQPLPSQANRSTYAPPRQGQQSFGDNSFPAPPVYQAGGAGEFASLNALAVPGGDTVTSKRKKRESSMIGMNYGLANQRKPSRNTLRDTSSSRVPEALESYAAQQRARDATPEQRYQQQQSQMY